VRVPYAFTLPMTLAFAERPFFGPALVPPIRRRGSIRSPLNAVSAISSSLHPLLPSLRHRDFYAEVMGAGCRSICCEARSMACSPFYILVELRPSKGRPVIEEFTRNRVLTCDTLKPSILSIQVLPLSHLSFAHLACVHLILFVLRLIDAELTLTRQTRRTPALYCPKRVQIPRITIAAGCSRGGGVAVYVSTFFLSLMSIAHLVRTQ